MTKPASYTVKASGIGVQLADSGQTIVRRFGAFCGFSGIRAFSKGNLWGFQPVDFVRPLIYTINPAVRVTQSSKLHN